MHYRRSGKTELLLSAFSLGTMRYLASEENAIAVVAAAVRSGINHIETARGYGNSERFLGVALRSLPEGDRPYITTKVPPIADGDLLDKQIDESLERLGVGTIDGLALHGINTWEHLDRAKAAITTLQRAKADGRIGHIGFSTHAPLEVILAAIETDFFEFVNLHYYYFFQRNEPAIALAERKDMGVFIISPADKGGLLYRPPETLKQLCYPFSPLGLTYRFLLSDRRITTLSLGAATPQELAFPLQFADAVGELTEAERSAFSRLQTHEDNVLKTDKCAQCYDCLPCPENINIPEVLRLRNLAVAYDMVDYGKYRYGMFENAGHWFPGNKGSRCTECGDCLPRCPENLDIPKLLKDADDRLGGKPRRRLWG